MRSSSPPFRSPLSIVPPELEAIDDAWNDEAPTQPGDVSERVTQVPSMPSELLAQRLMREATSDPPEDENERPTRPRPSSLAPPDLGPARPSDAVTYRPPIASALTPSVDLFGGPQERLDAPPRFHDTRIFDSDGPPLELDTSDDLPSQPFSPHEAPTKTVPDPTSALAPEDSLEFDLSASAAPHWSEQVNLEPLRSPLDLARGFSSLPPPPADPLRDMRDRYATGDFSGALEVAERVLAKNPDQEEAYRCAQSCRDVLADMYASRLGGTHRRASVIMSPDQIRWLSLDHRAGFLLSIIDGVSTVDELLDICGMPKLEALRILCNLLDQQAVALEA
ncbi:MAG: hypothetical protein GX607_08635 [Myxococcales bacterium]|nr:hypothetical protein [Myxococcales bacterium]